MSAQSAESRRLGTEEVLTEWAHLRDYGVRLADAAKRIGLSVPALEKRLERALNRGDRRGSRNPFGNDPETAPLRDVTLPITDPMFRWKYADFARSDAQAKARERPCSTCGAPRGAFCLARTGRWYKRAHADRRRPRPTLVPDPRR